MSLFQDVTYIIYKITVGGFLPGFGLRIDAPKVTADKGAPNIGIVPVRKFKTAS